MKIGVLTNLKAGGRNRSSLAVATEAGRHAQVLHQETAGSAMVPDAVAEFADRGVELLVVNGGDGTLQRALTEILGGLPGWRPYVAPLRSGRTNMVALDLGASRDPAGGLRGLIQEAETRGVEERVQTRPVLRLETGSDEPVRYGMFFGAGAICRAIELTHRSFPKGRAQGVFGSSLMTGTLLTQVARGRRDGVLAPDKIELALDGEGAGAEAYVVVMATTLQRLFLKLEPFWGEGPGSVRLTTLVSGSSGLGSSLPRILRGRPPRPGATGLESHNLDEARFRLDCDVSMDGELFGARPNRDVCLTASDRLDFLRV